MHSREAHASSPREDEVELCHSYGHLRISTICLKKSSTIELLTKHEAIIPWWVIVGLIGNYP